MSIGLRLVGRDELAYERLLEARNTLKTLAADSPWNKPLVDAAEGVAFFVEYGGLALVNAADVEKLTLKYTIEWSRWMDSPSEPQQADVTAVLLNWRRPYHLPRIVESLQAHAFIGEIVCFDNSGILDDIPGVTVIRSPLNVCTLGRFLAAGHAQHRIIYTQDDDVIVRNVPALYERFLTHRESITAGLDDSHYRHEANKTAFIQMGWGSFFLRDWVSVLHLWRARHGEDELLRRKADRIFTTLHGRHDPQHADIERLQHGGRDSDRDASSLWLRADHRALTELAVKRAMELRAEMKRRATVVETPQPA